MKIKTVFYGSLYDDEKSNYVEMVEVQFRECSASLKEKDVEVVSWAFDVLVKDEFDKNKIKSFVRLCAKKYFPGVLEVSQQNTTP